jgi:predicted nucleic acid-binding protein
MSLVNDLADGLLDTNIFIHAQANDAHTAECRRFLTALQEGRAQARLEPIVLHELSYALKHYMKQITKEQTAQYLLTILSWRGVQGDKDVMVDTVERWWNTQGLSFVDAYLAARAAADGHPVYTKNVREMVAQGVTVPDPLPGV